MSPTTREVEAARVERMRREAASRAAAQAPAPKSAQARRTARAEEAHRAATARNAWRCRVEECPELGVWHVPAEDTREAALAESRRHYLERHYKAPTATQRRAPVRKPPAKPLGSPPTTATRQAPRPPPRSSWDERTEPTWIDRL